MCSREIQNRSRDVLEKISSVFRMPSVFRIPSVIRIPSVWASFAVGVYFIFIFFWWWWCVCGWAACRSQQLSAFAAQPLRRQANTPILQERWLRERSRWVTLPTAGMRACAMLQQADCALIKIFGYVVFCDVPSSSALLSATFQVPARTAAHSAVCLL